MNYISKKELKKIAKEYNVNYGALKVALKEDEHKLNEINRLDVFETLTINCSDLFYSRNDDIKGIVEYLDHSLLIKLTSAYSNLRELHNG